MAGLQRRIRAKGGARDILVQHVLHHINASTDAAIRTKYKIDVPL